MSQIEDKAIIEFLRRSYTAADGLWFVQVENKYSYEEALDVDEKVWEILPKIQARKSRELLGIEGHSLQDLEQCLELKFISEGYGHSTTESTESSLQIQIHECPWLALLKKAGRLSLASEICDRVCLRDFAGWAGQFSDEIKFSLGEKMPDGAPVCELHFVRKEMVSSESS